MAGAVEPEKALHDAVAEAADSVVEDNGVACDPAMFGVRHMLSV